MSSTYLDYASTTPCDPRVCTSMQPYLEDIFGNDSSDHRYGYAATQAIQVAQKQVASLINAQHQDEIIFTSGATEAINMALKGIMLSSKFGKHIVTTKLEHRATLETCKFLNAFNIKTTYLPVNKNGQLNTNILHESLQQEPSLVSLSHVNNEVGIIYDVAKFAEIAKQNNSLIHIDAAQSIGKISVNVQELKCDLLSISGHKIYAPKGVGALYISRKIQPFMIPLLHGGGQQLGLRSGTLATAQIVALGKACEIAKQEMQKDFLHVQHLKTLLRNCLDKLSGVVVHAKQVATSPYILNMSFEGIDIDSLIASLPMLAMSKAAACSNLQGDTSHVLQAMGVDRQYLNNNLRISLGRFSTEKEVIAAAELLKQQVMRMRT